MRSSKRWRNWQTLPPKQAKRKGLRAGMKVRCPWCERAGVVVTRQGLMEHPKGDLDLPDTPVCEGSGQLIAMGENGQVIKKVGEQ